MLRLGWQWVHCWHWQWALCACEQVMASNEGSAWAAGGWGLKLWDWFHEEGTSGNGWVHSPTKVSQKLRLLFTKSTYRLQPLLMDANFLSKILGKTPLRSVFMIKGKKKVSACSMARSFSGGGSQKVLTIFRVYHMRCLNLSSQSNLERSGRRSHCFGSVQKGLSSPRLLIE